MQTVTILGATGSVGASTLKVLALHPDKFKVVGLSAYSNISKLLDISRQVKPQFLAVHTAAQADLLKRELGSDCPEIFYGENATALLAQQPASIVVSAIVGAAGLSSTYYALARGANVLIANKESLVMAGALLKKTAQQNGAKLLPIDSEHNAILQCLPRDLSGEFNDVQSITLTASGGPFLERPLSSFKDITVAQAVNHPKWSMGRKISVDSATMVNKGLEVIEAHWLFDLAPQNIQIVIHPQSIVHSLVNYTDGSSLAQLGATDMRIPIAYALSYPRRISSGCELLDFSQSLSLNFIPLEAQRFPALQLCYQALDAGMAACITLNAANELAVAAFLEKRITFPEITRFIQNSLEAYQRNSVNLETQASLSVILQYDQEIRAELETYLPH